MKLDSAQGRSWASVAEVCHKDASQNEKSACHSPYDPIVVIVFDEVKASTGCTCRKIYFWTWLVPCPQGNCKASGPTAAAVGQPHTKRHTTLPVLFG